MAQLFLQGHTETLPAHNEAKKTHANENPEQARVTGRPEQRRRGAIHHYGVPRTRRAPTRSRSAQPPSKGRPVETQQRHPGHPQSQEQQVIGPPTEVHHLQKWHRMWIYSTTSILEAHATQSQDINSLLIPRKAAGTQVSKETMGHVLTGLVMTPRSTRDTLSEAEEQPICGTAEYDPEKSSYTDAGYQTHSGCMLGTTQPSQQNV